MSIPASPPPPPKAAVCEVEVVVNGNEIWLVVIPPKPTLGCNEGNGWKTDGAVNELAGCCCCCGFWNIDNVFDSDATGWTFDPNIGCDVDWVPNWNPPPADWVGAPTQIAERKFKLHRVNYSHKKHKNKNIKQKITKTETRSCRCCASKHYDDVRLTLIKNLCKKNF